MGARFPRAWPLTLLTGVRPQGRMSTLANSQQALPFPRSANAEDGPRKVPPRNLTLCGRCPLGTNHRTATWGCAHTVARIRHQPLPASALCQACLPALSNILSKIFLVQFCWNRSIIRIFQRTRDTERSGDTGAGEAGRRVQSFPSQGQVSLALMTIHSHTPSYKNIGLERLSDLSKLHSSLMPWLICLHRE